jgi:hypothetical protein
MEWHKLDLSGSEQEPELGSSKHDNKPPVTVIYLRFLEELNNWQILTKVSCS